MLIYLLRHGLTAYNAEKRYQGQRDIPLSPAGRAQLRQADLRPETVYITPLCRTRQTAEVLFPGARLVEMKDLQEMCFGSFEGRNFIEMEHDPDYLALGERQLRKPLPGRRDQGCFFGAGVQGLCRTGGQGPCRWGRDTGHSGPRRHPDGCHGTLRPAPCGLLPLVRPPMRAATFWMQEIGRSSGCCTC